MVRFLFLMLFTTVASADTWSTSSGLSLSPSGISVTAPPVGTTPDVTYKDGTIQMNFSITGNGQRGNAASGPVRIISPAASTPSVLTDSDTFFKGIGR